MQLQVSHCVDACKSQSFTGKHNSVEGHITYSNKVDISLAFKKFGFEEAHQEEVLKKPLPAWVLLKLH